MLQMVRDVWVGGSLVPENPITCCPSLDLQLVDPYLRLSTKIGMAL
jgi:hypothetical protein